MKSQGERERNEQVVVGVCVFVIGLGEGERAGAVKKSFFFLVGK